MAERVLLIRLKVKDDGSTEIERVGNALGKVEKRADAASNATQRMTSQLSGMLARATALVGAAGIGLLAKQTFDYNQEVESTTIGIAGLLSANREYMNAQGARLEGDQAWAAALSESSGLMARIREEALKTAATVPQLAEAFATTLGSMRGAGITATLEETLTLTTRLTQAANAFKVPMEQMRQEINSLMTGQVTQDSLLAHRLGFTNADIQRLKEQGTLVEEIVKRTEAYAKAAEAQSNTVLGKLRNTWEMVISTLSDSFNATLQKIGPVLDGIFGWFKDNGPKIATSVQVVVGAIGNVVSSIGSWARANAELLKEVAAMSAVALGAVAAYTLVGGAIAFLLSPIGLVIAGIVGMAFAWEKAREWKPIEVNGLSLADYMKATFQVLRGSLEIFVENVEGSWRVLGLFVGKILRELEATVVGSMSNIVGIFNKLPAPLFGDRLKQWRTDLAEFDTSLSEVAKQTAKRATATNAEYEKAVKDRRTIIDGLQKSSVDAASNTLLGKDSAGSIREGVANLLDPIIEQVKGSFDKAKATAAAGMKSVADAITGADKPTAPKGPGEGASKLEELQGDYLRWIDEFRKKATAAGDPLDEALAEIDIARTAAIAKMKEQQKDIAALGGAKDGGLGRGVINAFFNQKETEAAAKTIEDLNKKTLESFKAMEELKTEISSAQADERIALIKDEVEREAAERIKSIDDWERAEKLSVETAIEDARLKAEAIRAIEEEADRRRKRADEDATRRRKEQEVGTKEWLTSLNKQMTDAFGTISQQVTRAAEDSIQALTNAFDGFFDDILSGHFDLEDSLKDLGKSLGQVWSRVFSNILTQSLTTDKSISAGFKDVFKQINGLKGMDAAMAGAGIGSMIGGFGPKQTYASEGGTIGGAIGAVIAAIVTQGTATAAGAAIGGIIGTAIGGMIQKGVDWIEVAIVDGAATINERGISAETREQIVRDINRQVRDLTKGYEKLIDLFPEQLREQIRAAVRKVNLGPQRTEEGDIRDENALGALGDFLGEDLPAGVFDAYSAAITRGLELLGVEGDRINQMMEYWGSLQGKELQEAVRRYITTLVGAIEVRDLFTASFDTRLGEARRLASMTSLDQMTAMQDQIALMVASLADLDVEDQIAAQQAITDLGRKRYEMEIAYLQRIDSIQQSIANSVAAQREQIQMAGMDEQGKMDFIWGRMNALRGNLAGATDPEEIQRIMQQLQGYVSQAFSLAPDNAEVRNALLAILDDTERLSNEQLEEARAAVAAQDQKVADLMMSAAEALLRAAEALTGLVPNPEGPPVGGGNPDDRQPGNPFYRDRPNAGGGEAPGIVAEEDAIRSDIRDIFQAIRDRGAEKLEVEHTFEWRKSGDPLLDMIASLVEVRTIERVRNNPDLLTRYTD